MQTVYKTNDGKIFESERLARDWEKEHCPTKHYTVIVYVEIPAVITVTASNREEAFEKAEKEWAYEDLSDDYKVVGAEIDDEWEE